MNELLKTVIEVCQVKCRVRTCESTEIYGQITCPRWGLNIEYDGQNRFMYCKQHYHDKMEWMEGVQGNEGLVGRVL